MIPTISATTPISINPEVGDISQLGAGAGNTPGLPGLNGFQLPSLNDVSSNIATGSSAVTGAEPTTFGQMMQSMVRDVNQSEANAAAKVQDVLAGGKTQVHEAMIAMEDASVSFQMLGEVKNKLVEAYQQVMQMQI